MLEKNQKDQQGFTLIELLIVVAIIAILAAIAVPNFLEAQVRSKVSRVKSDMRSVATALESYMVDHNTYPLSWERPITAPPATGNPTDPVQQAISAGVALSTPVSYISNAQIRDPFVKFGIMDPNPQYRNKNYLAIATGNRSKKDSGPNIGDRVWARDCFGIVSFGPDGDDDTRSGGYPFGRQSKSSKGTPGWAGPYDSTNGTKSRGDVFRCAPKPPKTWVIDTGSNLNPPADPFAY